MHANLAIATLMPYHRDNLRATRQSSLSGFATMNSVLAASTTVTLSMMYCMCSTYSSESVSTSLSRHSTQRSSSGCSSARDFCCQKPALRSCSDWLFATSTGVGYSSIVDVDVDPVPMAPNTGWRCCCVTHNREIDRHQQAVKHLERRETQRERTGLGRRFLFRTATTRRRRRRLLEREQIVAVGDLDALSLRRSDEIAEVLNESSQLLQSGFDTDQFRRNVEQRANRAQRVVAHTDLQVCESAAAVHGDELGKRRERLARDECREQHFPRRDRGLAHDRFFVDERRQEPLEYNGDVGENVARVDLHELAQPL
uniref:Uncharacterized protein n=1 Tax=Globisporangium ultimum (strain ATCC 200006 / CBS 805.95 / DAOM BR144) TaxID=431595 RepID=K3WE65_GLOUD